MRPYTNPFDIGNFTIESGVVASPAAASNYIGAVPVNARSQLALLTFALATDANAANRFCEIQLHRGADVYILDDSFVPQVASKAYAYVAHPHATRPTAVLSATVSFPLPDIPLFLEGDTVRIVVHNIQAADQLSAIRMTWKIWPYEQ